VRSRFVTHLVVAVLAVCFAPAAFAAGPTSAERVLLEEVNRTRAAHQLAPLRLDATLQRAARSHSLDMLERNYFSHGSVAERLRSFGAKGPRLGENLAWGAGSAADARSIVRMWLSSPPHRANLLRPGFRRIGVGAVVGAFAGYADVRVVTADFAGF
jgi:uncharacterized protein YkwD